MAGTGGITDALLEEIKRRTDLAELVASYGIDVRVAGSSRKACCPFHNEKTPSFNINVAQGFYHCFGCGESGDAIKFVEKMEGLNFVEAVKKLAQPLGIEVNDREDPELGRRKRLRALLSELAAFYRRCLVKTKEAEPAREYLKKRGLSDEICEAWTIGYAPRGAATIFKWAEKYGYTVEELEDAGVVKAPRYEGDQGYHRFSGRLMFTIRDRQKSVCGFSGRFLGEDKKTSKYVNSPETPVFKKSNVLFGFDRAQGEIVRSPHREVIACEGQIDCIRLHSCGFKTAVASQGTAFTEEHARMLRRVADAAVLMYDDDGAGHKATIKVAGLLLALEMPVRVVALPDGDDPDSFLVKHPASDLQALIDSAESIMSFQCRAEREKEAAPDSLDAVSRITKAVLATVAKCPSAVLRASMCAEAAKLLALPVAALQEELEAKRSEIRDKRSEIRDKRSDKGDAGDAEGDEEWEEVEDPVEVEGERAEKVNPPGAKETAFMEFLMENEGDRDLAEKVAEFLPGEVFEHDFTRRFTEVWRAGAESGEDTFAAFGDSLGEAERPFLDAVLAGSGKTLASGLKLSAVFEDFVRTLWSARLERERGRLPAAADDEATIAKRLSLTADVKRMRQQRWSAVKEMIKTRISQSKGDNQNGLQGSD